MIVFSSLESWPKGFGHFLCSRFVMWKLKVTNVTKQIALQRSFFHTTCTMLKFLLLEKICGTGLKPDTLHFSGNEELFFSVVNTYHFCNLKQLKIRKKWRNYK